uniref:Uncharacterized protein n=1 Tax=Rhabditophanes sp. KR3021 TaxID=114890 RepID=A0AC35U299_9BILA
MAKGGNPDFCTGGTAQANCPKCRTQTVFRAIDSTLDHDRRNYFMNPKRVLEDATRKIGVIINFQDKHRKSQSKFMSQKIDHITKVARTHEETVKRSSEVAKASASEIEKYKKKAESSTAIAQKFRDQFIDLNKKYAELRTSISLTQRTITKTSPPIKKMGTGVKRHTAQKNNFATKSKQPHFTTPMLLGYSSAVTPKSSNQQYGNPFANTSAISSVGGNTKLNQLFDISAERTVLKAKGEPHATSTPFSDREYQQENQYKFFDEDTPRPRNHFGNNNLY